jgi:hypothetical protein
MAKHRLTDKEIDYKIILSGQVCKTITRISTALIKYGCIGVLGYFFFDSLKELAGKTTIASVLIKLVTDLKMNQWFGYVVGGGGLIYGAIRHRQTKKTRKNFDEHIKKLELMIDPDRQSSRLNSFGETNENDR